MVVAAPVMCIHVVNPQNCYKLNVFNIFATHCTKYIIKC